MLKWIRKVRQASKEQKWFIATIVITGVIIVALCFYPFYRLAFG